MSKANPEWFELSKERWTEKSEDGWVQFRDSQKQKVYDSEWCLRNFLSNHNIKVKEFESLEEISKYVNKIAQSAWAKRRWGRQNLIKVVECKRKNESYARKCTNTIAMNPSMWSEVYVLHELAHILSVFGTSHGRHFCRTFLELIEHILGSEAKKALKKQFVCHGVKSTPLIEYSEETKKKMQERGRKLAATYL